MLLVSLPQTCSLQFSEKQSLHFQDHENPVRREKSCCGYGSGHGSQRTHNISSTDTWQETSELTEENAFGLVLTFSPVMGQTCCFGWTDGHVFLSISQSFTCCNPGQPYKHVWDDTKQVILLTSALRPFAKHHIYIGIQVALCRFLLGLFVISTPRLLSSYFSVVLFCSV